MSVNLENSHAVHNRSGLLNHALGSLYFGCYMFLLLNSRFEINTEIIKIRDRP